MIRRNLITYLQEWRNRAKRKPLILRGARQVGKTTLVDSFGAEFEDYMYFNLEIERDRELFDSIEDINSLVQALFLQRGMPKGSGKSTLIFIDEIQESPKAIQKLRYFYEQFPELYIIAAGSLLEHALSEVQNFPVGRVEYAVLHPMNFVEFLEALGEVEVLIQLRTIPIQKFAHHRLLQLFHQYAIIGGMPEVVEHYASTRDFTSLATIYSSLIQSYKDDVEKYARNSPESRIIRHIIDTAAIEADSRIKFAGFGNSNYRSREVGEAMRSLENARLIQLLYPTTQVSPPAAPDIKKSPRLQLLDTGLLNYSLGIQGELIGIRDLNAAHRGKIIQHLVTQELISVHETPSFKPRFWTRQKSKATSEVDLVYASNQYLIPIEIKSGASGKLRSLQEFIDRCDHQYGIRLSSNQFVIQDAVTASGKSYKLMNLPYCLGTMIPEYIEWFIREY